jgi:hypothetical protein
MHPNPPNLMHNPAMQPHEMMHIPSMHPTQPNPPLVVHTNPHPNHSGNLNRNAMVTIKARFTKGAEAINEDGLRALLINNLEIIKQHPRSSIFPMDLLTTFQEDLSLMAFVQPRLAQWRAEINDERNPVPLHHSPNPLTGLSPFECTLIKDILHFIGGEVRPPDVIALTDLHEGRVTQQTTTAHYAQAFMHRARVLPNESQQSLCLLYIKGLKPYIQKHCTHDLNNGRWTNLHDLIQHSHVVEEKGNTLFKFHPHNKQGNRRGDDRDANNGGGRKRQQPTADPSVAALAAATITPPKTDRKDGQEPRWQPPPGPYAPKANYRECRLWVDPNQPPARLPTLTNEDKNLLYSYGLCFCCRKGPHWEDKAMGKLHPECDFHNSKHAGAGQKKQKHHHNNVNGGAGPSH